MFGIMFYLSMYIYLIRRKNRINLVNTYMSENNISMYLAIESAREIQSKINILIK